MTPPHLTVGQLFPDGDVVAQWVFSATAVAEDLSIVTKPMQAAEERQDLRALLFYYRHLVTRLYEAERLVTVAEQHTEVSSFLAGLLDRSPLGVDLREVYLPASPTERSVVADLYGMVRHRSVHYMRVGSDELATVLRNHSRYPARVDMTANDSGQPEVWYQWVHAVTLADLYGDLAAPDFIDDMRRRSALVGRIAMSWGMVAGLALLLHVRRLGLDAEDLGVAPGTPDGV